jgi:protein-disulfide isomerase
MRKTAAFLLLALGAAVPARGNEATRSRVAAYFKGWYSICPSTEVTAVASSEVAIPGYETYRTERRCASKNRDESNIVLVDTAANEIFVGQVLHDDSRKDRPFSAVADLPPIQAALQEGLGLPVEVEVGEGSDRASLLPLRIRIREAPEAWARLPAYASRDGATLLLGEFFPFGSDPMAEREKLLQASPGVREGKGKFLVTAFIDFQCDKCRVRTPQLRDFAWTHGGALEVHFLPLVKIHDWAWAAAENAAALANVSPSLYSRYEAALFPMASSMSPQGARELATDVAQAAGQLDAYQAELDSGRARHRVLQDIDLALRLGLNSTPAFFFRGAFLTSEKDLAESYIGGRLGASAPHETARPR